MVRRLFAPVGVALFALSHVLAGGCSSSSSLAEGGACQSFCTKWVGSDCRLRPTMEACVGKCQEEQSRCRPEANALLRCATIEAQIACDSSSGTPRIVGCAPRESSLDDCMVCDRVCEKVSACALGPSREECLATCLDRRCSVAHRRLVECLATWPARCDAELGPVAPEGCMSEWRQASACMSLHGQGKPFRWLPVETLPGDSGTDASGTDG